MLINKEHCRDLDQATTREWLETNGIGGFASSTIIGMNTRRYHGLLVAALHPPVGRIVALSSYQETIRLGSREYELGCNRYGDTVHPQGYRHLDYMQNTPYPTFGYKIGKAQIRKSVFMPYGRNATVVTYESDQDVSLDVRPLVAYRDYHHTTRQNGDISSSPEVGVNALRYTPYAGQPPLHISHTGGQFVGDGFWYFDFEYEVERYRGLDAVEDLFSPGSLTFALGPDEPVSLIASVDDPIPIDEVDEIRASEIDRRKNRSASIVVEDEFAVSLANAADTYVVKRDGNLSTIIAGYPWFSDWGRDTFIALPGITLVTGRFDHAAGMLKAFAKACDKGMIPNRFPDHGEVADYNSVDASLWYIQAVNRYLDYTGDFAGIEEEIWPTIKSIVTHYHDGTRYGIHADTDGLITAGEGNVQLTWMDAKVGDWVVTPRHGKPVEINALWYHALRVSEALATRFGDITFAEKASAYAERLQAVFEPTYWNEERGCLYDLVHADGKDGAIRPNQVLALSLPHRLVEQERSRKILEVIEQNLLTPRGMRSLWQGHPSYAGHYGGDQHSRDGAYHQGTVWGWLIGPFVTAYVNVNGRSEAARNQAAEFIEPFRSHLFEAGIGHISEIFDGDAPHESRGCYAQAWSVGEVLRCYVEDILGERPEPWFSEPVVVSKSGN
jgi:predicted glycogen debranching enzyme